MKTFLHNTGKICLYLMLMCSSAMAQDINFSQFYDVPVLRNPALAGLFTGDVRVSSGFRNQWQSVTVPYRTMVLSGEIKKVVWNGSNENQARKHSLNRDSLRVLQFGYDIVQCHMVMSDLSGIVRALVDRLQMNTFHFVGYFACQYQTLVRFFFMFRCMRSHRFVRWSDFGTWKCKRKWNKGGK